MNTYFVIMKSGSFFWLCADSFEIVWGKADSICQFNTIVFYYKGHKVCDIPKSQLERIERQRLFTDNEVMYND